MRSGTDGTGVPTVGAAEHGGRSPQSPLYVLAPFVPSPPEVVDRILELATVTRDDLVYDLGCGDGRILVAAARERGARGVGVDIEPFRIAEAQALAQAAGVADLLELSVLDALSVDLSAATVVVLYLVQWSTDRLLPRLEAQLRPGARIVSHAFPFTGWRPERVERWADAEGQLRSLYLWVAGERGTGHGDRGGPADGPWPEVAAPIDGLDWGRFSPHLGSSFTLELADRSLELVLVEAELLPAYTSAPGALRRPFSLCFRAVGGTAVDQGIHALVHPALGRLELFLVPLMAPGSTVSYQAIFT